MEFFDDIIQFYHPSGKHTSVLFTYLASLLAAFHGQEGMLDEQPLGLHKKSRVITATTASRHTIAQSTQLPRARKVIALR